MLPQVVAAHAVLVKIFLFFLLTGFGVAFVASKEALRFKKAAFVYTMTFQALATMIAFSGIVAWVMSDMPTTLSVIVMVVAWAALMFIEIKKYKLIKVADLRQEQARRLLKGVFVKITAVQVLLVAAIVVLKVLEAKGAISLS